jgi:hypothetical protein
MVGLLLGVCAGCYVGAMFTTLPLVAFPDEPLYKKTLLWFLVASAVSGAAALAMHFWL